MKFILSFLCLIFSFSIYALDISVSYATFKGDKSDYIEVYLYAVGSTLEQKIIGPQIQSSIEVTILFKQGDNIIQFDKFLLNGPLSAEPSDFMDLKRYGLTPGEYQMEVTVIDQNKPKNQGTFTSDKFKIDYSHSKVAISDIQLLTSCKGAKEPSAFVKNGYFMEPTPFNFYNKNLETLFFYNEIYNTNLLEEKTFVVSYSITLDSKLSNNKEVVIGHKTKKTAENTVLMMPIDIAPLASGNYILQVQVKDGDRVLAKKAISFQRLNPYVQPKFEESESFDITKTFVEDLSRDDLIYSLRAIMPLISSTDAKILNGILANEDPVKLKSRLFTFWANKDPNKPKAAYDKYMEVARAVDNQFNSGLGHGFESDRGFIFLKYGRPTNMISVTDEPESAPYEIWFYDQFPFTGQSDVKFLFYNPSYAAGQYQLLHSNCRGEINDPTWVVKLYKNIDQRDIVGEDYLNANEIRDGNNRNAVRYFNDF